MNYEETLEFLYSKLPMFQRVGPPAFKKDLSNTLALCEALGNPQGRFRSVHIAGTNGKGSVSHLMAAILQASGFKTGLYTSPHYRDFRERIKINGQMVPPQFVVDFVARTKDLISAIEPSFFELTVAMAFDFFAQEKVDFAIIETGLGGRLDSTNVVQPELSIITNISFDHMQFLGETLPEIAGEKAGIIKEGVPVLIGERQQEVQSVFERKAKEQSAPLFFAEDRLEVLLEKTTPSGLELDLTKAGKPSQRGVKTDLSARYQILNIRTAVAGADLLSTRFPELTPETIRLALANVRELTGFMGRWMQLSTDPVIICDSAHNEGGIQRLLEELSYYQFKNLNFVFGAVKDKDLSRALNLLPKKAKYYLCRPDIPRGMAVEELALLMKSRGFDCESFASVSEAFIRAKMDTRSGDLMLVAGSIFVVGEVLEFHSLNTTVAHE